MSARRGARPPILRGACPACGAPVVLLQWGACCTARIAGLRRAHDGPGGDGPCDFRLGRVVAGKRLTDNQLTDLLTRPKTREIGGFASKRRPGTTFSAKLVLEHTGSSWRAKMVFDGPRARHAPRTKDPQRGGDA